VTIELRGTGYFGKVPTAGDFQRQATADGPDSKTFDWFNDGWTRHALAGRRPDLGEPVSFCWQRPGADRTFVGVMVASRDRAGRRFPLLVFASIAGTARFADAVACSHEFFERATSVAESGRAGVDVPALRAHVDALRTAFDADGVRRQAEWQASVTADAWANGDAAARLRSVQYAFSGGGRPNFVLRGRWQGDLRHLAAVTSLLEATSGSPPAMLFWSRRDGEIAWRAAWDYAVPSLFEALLWHDVQSATAFDTDPGAVAVPATFAGRPASPDARLSDLLSPR